MHPSFLKTVLSAFAITTAVLSPAEDLIFEAESANFTAPFERGADPEASGSAFLIVPENVPNARERSTSTGSATYTLDVPTAGTYELWAKVFTPGAPRTREDSFFVDFHGQQLTWRIHDWADNWVWRKLTTEEITDDIAFDLPKGKQTLVLRHRVSGTLIDQLKLVPVRSRAALFDGFDPLTLEASSTTRYENLSPYFDMPTLEVPSFPDRDFSIVDFGAREGGIELATDAFARAIAACHEQGGGRVVVPPGIWLTGPIHLKSNVNLHLEKGAQVRFSENRADYLPVVFTRWEGMECYNYSAPIYAYQQSNIALTGKGSFHGQGQAWWEWKRTLQKPAAIALYQKIQEGVPVAERVMGDTIDGLRPNFVQFVDCQNVLIENLTFFDGPMWTLHPVYVDNMIVRGVKVITVGPNNDGINPDSTRNLLIEDCYFSTGDDCVVLKSGLNEDGWRVNRPTENVVIRNIYGNEGHGGVVMGSEMSGGIRNVYAHDSTFVGTDRGIRLKSMRGRGAFIEGLYCERIKMSDIGGQAIRINAFYSSSTLKPATQVPPRFSNMLFKDITCDGAARAIEITGLEEALVSNLSFENVSIKANKGFIATDATELSLENVSIEAADNIPFAFHQTSDVSLRHVSDGSGQRPQLEITGVRSANIEFAD